MDFKDFINCLSDTRTHSKILPLFDFQDHPSARDVDRRNWVPTLTRILYQCDEETAFRSLRPEMRTDKTVRTKRTAAETKLASQESSVSRIQETVNEEIQKASTVDPGYVRPPNKSILRLGVQTKCTKQAITNSSGETRRLLCTENTLADRNAGDEPTCW